MPSEIENVQYLYLVMTCGGPSTIDWAKVSEELGVSKGAATKRWSRLKQAMKKNTNPGPTAHQLLWLCLKHSTRDKVGALTYLWAMDWNAIAEKCNTTAGAASKRYSRLKQAFDSGAAAPQPNPTQDKDSSTGIKNGKTATQAKRKRATKTEAAGSEDEDGVTREQVSDNKEKGKEKLVVDPKPKRARTSKKNQSKAEVKKEGSSDVEVLGERSGSQGPILPSPALLAELEAAVQHAHAEMHTSGNGHQIQDLSEDELYNTTKATQDKVTSWLEGAVEADEDIKV